MAVDMFLKIDDYKGESKDDSHTDEIDVLAWSWGISQSGTTHSGGGSGAGKTDVQDVSVTKWVDKASANLMKICLTGKHFKKAELVIRKAGDKPLEYIKLTMEEGLISSVSGGGSGGEERLTENVTLNFAKFKYEYYPQKADGSGDAAVEVVYDIPANKEG